MKEQICLNCVEDLYAILRDHIKWLAYTKSNNGNVMLQAGELEGELLAELVKGWHFYKDKHLSSSELLTVVKRMLDYRLSELAYRYLVTHRRAEMYMLDSDELLFSIQGGRLDEYIDSVHRVNEFIRILTPYELDVVRALLYPDDRMRQQIELMGLRKAWVYKNPKLIASANLVAAALHLDKKVLRHVWATIRRKWARIERSEMDKVDKGVKEIARERGKQLLLTLAAELEMKVDAATHVYEVVIAIRNDVEQQGVPEPDEVSDDLFWLLVDLGFIDDAGELLDLEIEQPSLSEPESESVEAELPDELPGCWGTSDKDDPSCKRCKLADACYAQRMATRKSLACFGRLYDEDDEACSICLEWRDCRKLTSAD